MSPNSKHVSFLESFNPVSLNSQSEVKKYLRHIPTGFEALINFGAEIGL